MMRRYRLNRVGVPGLVAAMVLLAGGLASPANAQVVQVTRADARNLVGFNLGYFMVNGEDSRVDDDVLLANLNDLAFRDRRFQQLDLRWRVAVRRQQLPRDWRRRWLLSAHRDIGLPRLRERQRQRNRAGPQAQASCRYRPPFASCRWDAAPRSNPISGAASASSTGATPSRVSSSISRTARFFASSTRRMARPSGR